jgi:hypothetical protein
MGPTDSARTVAITRLDLTALDAIGWDPANVPEPSCMAMACMAGMFAACRLGRRISIRLSRSSFIRYGQQHSVTFEPRVCRAPHTTSNDAGSCRSSACHAGTSPAYSLTSSIRLH